MSRGLGTVSVVACVAAAGLLAAFGGAAPASTGATLVSTDADDMMGSIIWRGLDPQTKARVCHAYYAGGKRAIRQVVTVSNPNSSRIDWSTQKSFQRVAVATCEQRKRNR